MVDLTIKPLIWARKDQVQHALRMPHLVACYSEKEAQNRADCMPLYDRSALDAAVAAALEQPAMEVLRELVDSLNAYASFPQSIQPALSRARALVDAAMQQEQQG